MKRMYDHKNFIAAGCVRHERMLEYALSGQNMSRRGISFSKIILAAFAIGIIVAMSVPLCTTILAQSRLEINQANARAAKDAALAAYYADNDIVKIKFNTADGKASAQSVTSGSAVPDADISAWTVEKMGTKLYKTWFISIDADSGSGIETTICYAE